MNKKNKKQDDVPAMIFVSFLGIIIISLVAIKIFEL